MESHMHYKNKTKLKNLKHKYLVFPFGFVKKMFENLVTKKVLRESKVQLELTPSLENIAEPGTLRSQECVMCARDQVC